MVIRIEEEKFKKEIEDDAFFMYKLNQDLCDDTGSRNVTLPTERQSRTPAFLQKACQFAEDYNYIL